MDDEPLFCFDNDEDEFAVTDQILDEGDIDADPVTPYGSASPSSAAHTGTGTAAAPGRLHLSSAQIWQTPGPGPEHEPEHSSPPPLTYSPSPRPYSSFAHRHQDGTLGQENGRHHDSTRHQRQRYSSRKNSTHHRHQLSRQGSVQGHEQDIHDLTDRISDLSLRRRYQEPDGRTHRHRKSFEKDHRDAPSTPPSDYEEQHEHRAPRRHHSHAAEPRHVRSGPRNGDEDPEVSAHEDLRHPGNRVPRYRSTHDAEPQYSRLATLVDPEDPDPEHPGVGLGGDEEFVELVPTNEALEVMYNGDEETRVTAKKVGAQVVHACQQNGKVVIMAGQATAQWWMSPEMAKRRRAAGRKVYNASSQVVSGAGNVIWTSTPVGRVCTSVSTNVSAFKSAPLSYTWDFVRRKDSGAASAPSGNTNKRNSDEDFDDDMQHAREPAIADEDDGFGSDFDEDGCMGLMFGEE